MGSGFFACSAPDGVGGQDGLGRIERPSSVARSACNSSAVATNDAGSSDPRTRPGAPFRRNGGTGETVAVRCWLACYCRGRGCCCRNRGPAEIGAVDPHAVHDHGKPARQGNLRGLHAAPFRDPHGPGPQRRPAAVMQEDVGRLVKGGAHHRITAAADVAIVIGLPGAVAPWRQTEVRSDISRS
jgi:hypothetical protein